MLALLYGAVLSLAGSVPRRAARPASQRLVASHRCGWPVATEAANELRLADDAGDGSGPGEDVYEVVLARPVGMQLMERPGSGVTVSMVYDAGNAANEGVRVGDVVLATSASIGPQMWEKSTVAGVESAIRTRVDGKVRLRLRRGTQRPPTWVAPLQWAYDVELGRPLGSMGKVLLRQRASSGRAWRLRAVCTPKGKPGRLGAQPLPRVRELSASKATDSTGFGPTGSGWSSEIGRDRARRDPNPNPYPYTLTHTP
jgi:hypothetical protein